MRTKDQTKAAEGQREEGKPASAGAPGTVSAEAGLRAELDRLAGENSGLRAEMDRLAAENSDLRRANEDLANKLLVARAAPHLVAAPCEVRRFDELGDAAAAVGISAGEAFAATLSADGNTLTVVTRDGRKLSKTRGGA